MVRRTEQEALFKDAPPFPLEICRCPPIRPTVELGGTGGGEGRKGAAALMGGGMAMLLGEAEEAVLMRWRRRQEGEGDISEEGEGRWMQGCQVLRGDIAIFSVAS